MCALKWLDATHILQELRNWNVKASLAQRCLGKIVVED